MQLELPSCATNDDLRKKCIYCDGKCVKNGHANGRQRYRCTSCSKSFSDVYVYKACSANTDRHLVSLLKEGCGIRSIARLLKISPATVMRRIIKVSRTITRPMIIFGKEYELDEVCTYIKRKTNLRWIVYAVRKDSKEVIDFTVGKRTCRTLKLVADTLILSQASRINTDKLGLYKMLLPKSIHDTRPYGTNHIERQNLNLRTHLKRLNRRTICFSKSVKMLVACLRIYFWG